MPILPKFLKRKNSGRRGRHEATPVTIATPLSPVQEAVHIPLSDSGSPRPVPPPQLFHSHADDFEHHDLHRSHSNLGDDLHDPHSRLYETFSSAHSQDGHANIPRVIREDDGAGIHGHHFDDHTDGIRSEHPGDLGFVQTDRSGGQAPLPVFIAPSDHSGSSHSSQKVTFIGDLRSHDRGTPHTQRKALSTSSRSMSRRVPVVAPSTIREHYGSHRRHVSEPLYPSPPRMSRPEYRYEFRRPYLIFTDFGEGLEVGNEEDGFMRYQDYRDTAHLRANRQDTYYVIPGSTPVIFNDASGNELYTVDAWRYNTPTLRRKQYIIEDENGRELFRVGGSGSSRYSSDGYSSGSHSSNLPKIQYLDSDLGSMHHRRARPNLKYYNENIRRAPAIASRRPSYHAAATPLTRSALFEDDDRTVSSQVSSNPDIVIVNEDGERIYDSREALVPGQPPHVQSQYVTEVSYPSRPDSGHVDEFGRPIDRPRSPEYPWGTSSTESDESYGGEGSRRHSRVFRA